MKDDELVKALRDMLPPKVDYAKLVCAEGFAHGQHYVWTEPEPYIIDEAATRIEQLARENNTLRNELCEKCGMYKTAHEGSCDGCRWKPCGVEEIEKCARFFIDDGGQCSAPSCKDEDGRGYKICVTCGGDKTKCCLLGQSI